MIRRSNKHKEERERRDLRVRCFTASEFDAFFDVLRDYRDSGDEIRYRNYMLCYLAYRLALRVSEACMLCRKHFKYINENRVLVPTVKQREDTIPLIPLAVKNDAKKEIIEYLRRLHPRKDGLFEGSWRRNITTNMARLIFNRICEEAGVKTGADGRTFHSLRHTRAVRLYESTGHNVLQVMRILRHRSVKTTLIYLEGIMSVKEQQAAADAVEDPF